MEGLQTRINAESTRRYEMLSQFAEGIKTAIIFGRATYTDNYKLQLQQCDFINFRSIFLPLDCKNDKIEIFSGGNFITSFPSQIIKRLPVVGKCGNLIEYDLAILIKCHIIPEKLIAQNSRIEIISPIEFCACYDINICNSREDFRKMNEYANLTGIFNVRQIGEVSHLKELSNGFFIICDAAKFKPMRVSIADKIIFDINEYTFKYHALPISKNAAEIRKIAGGYFHEKLGADLTGYVLQFCEFRDLYFISFNPTKYNNIAEIYNGPKNYIEFSTATNIKFEYNNVQYTQKIGTDIELFGSFANLLGTFDGRYALRFTD